MRKSRVIQKHSGLINKTEIISSAIEYGDLYQTWQGFPAAEPGHQATYQAAVKQVQRSTWKANLLRQVTRLSLFVFDAACLVLFRILDKSGHGLEMSRSDVAQ